MKKLILSIALLTSQLCFAIPVVDENVANHGTITIYPDHQNPHRFYVAPNVVKMSLNQDGSPNFTYDEHRKGMFKVVAILQMLLAPAFTRHELEVAKAEILNKDPLAEFSGLPFIASKLMLSGTLPQLLSYQECDHVGGLIGQEQACGMVLTSLGRKILNKAIDQKTLFTTLQFQYSVQAVLKKADGTYEDFVMTHSIAGEIRGDVMSQYPHQMHRL